MASFQEPGGSCSQSEGSLGQPPGFLGPTACLAVVSHLEGATKTRDPDGRLPDRDGLHRARLRADAERHGHRGPPPNGVARGHGSDRVPALVRGDRAEPDRLRLPGDPAGAVAHGPRRMGRSPDFSGEARGRRGRGRAARPGRLDPDPRRRPAPARGPPDVHDGHRDEALHSGQLHPQLQCADRIRNCIPARPHPHRDCGRLRRGHVVCVHPTMSALRDDVLRERQPGELGSKTLYCPRPWAADPWSFSFSAGPPRSAAWAWS